MKASNQNLDRQVTSHRLFTYLDNFFFFSLRSKNVENGIPEVLLEDTLT